MWALYCQGVSVVYGISSSVFKIISQEIRSIKKYDIKFSSGFYSSLKELPYKNSHIKISKY